MSLLDKRGNPTKGYPKPPVPKSKWCNHSRHHPQVPDEETLESMPSADVWQKYPRFDGVCEDCGEQVILYGSRAHYLAGDW